MTTTINKTMSKSKSKLSQPSSGTVEYRNYQDFISKHYVDKDDKETLITNTRIGNPGGKYHISDAEYPIFLDLYYRDIVSKGANEYLTEKQLETGGPIVVDIDLRYDYEITEKQYRKAHIDEIVQVYLEELNSIYRFDDKDKFLVFIFEKPSVNRLEDKKITKDGIHMIIGIQSDRTTQTILRSRIVKKMDETDLWSKIDKSAACRSSALARSINSRRITRSARMLRISV